MVKFKAFRIIDGKSRNVIVDENGKVINRNPSKDELKEVEKEIRTPQDTRKVLIYTDEELLNHLRKFYIKHKIPPTREDFANSYPYYPSYATYRARFGSWSNALKLVGLDIDSRILNGFLKTENERGRLGELLIKNHFEKNPLDLSGSNCMSPYDGICPNGMTYDVKSSKFHNDRKGYLFNFRNRYKDRIQILYLMGFNDDYTQLNHAWRIQTWELINKDLIFIGSTIDSTFNITNMKKCEITDKIRPIIYTGK